MKKAILISFFIFVLLNLAYTQTESNFERANRNLNLVYQKISIAYKEDTLFLRCLKDAQKQWTKFRDAQLKMKFPPYEDLEIGILPMCKDQYLARLTDERIKELELWLDVYEETDICPGSIRIKDE